MHALSAFFLKQALPAGLLLSVFQGCGPFSGDPPPSCVTIEFPGDHECTFAEMRDFYVRGSFSPATGTPGNIRVELFSGNTPTGAPLRVVQSRVDGTGVTPANSVLADYANGKVWGAISPAIVPDLLATPGSIYNPNNKVMVTQTWYAAIIQGGATKSFDTTYTDEHWNPLKDLSAGTYTVRVTGMSGDASGSSATKQIHLGSVPKLFGRFSPASHLAKLKAYASLYQLRLFTDLFPGYFKADLEGSPTYEITARWRPNNAIEVVNDLPGATTGNADKTRAFVLYNIKPSSTTQQLEIGTLLKAGLADHANTTWLYYDLGEPSLDFINAAGGNSHVEGSIVPLEAGRRLVLPRAELHPVNSDANASQENLWVEGDPTPRTLFKAPLTTIQIPAGQILDLFGVVRPIATTLDAVPGLPCAYSAKNYIANIQYTIKETGQPDVILNKAVGLSRKYLASNPTLSNCEFLHRFDAFATAGDRLMEIQALDVQNAPVSGTSVTLWVQVR